MYLDDGPISPVDVRWLVLFSVKTRKVVYDSECAEKNGSKSS